MEKNNPEEQLSTVARELPPSAIREFFDIVYSTPDCISLGVGEPDFITPWTISDSGIYAIKDGCTHYTPNRGLPELCQLISEYIENKLCVSYNPETQVLVTMGVSQGLDLTLRSIINPGDEVIIFEPCYVSYAANIRLVHGVPVIIPTLPEDSFRIDTEKLRKSVTRRTKAILLNHPANPTGAVIDRQTIQEIARIAIENNLIVITDEIYSEIVFDEDYYSIIKIPEMKQRTVYLNGFSKSHAMTGWRLGYIAGPEYIVETMLKIHQYTALCAPSISQYAAVEAMKRGGKEVKKMLSEYTKRRNFITGRFNEIGLPCTIPGGAFYVFPDISSSGMDGHEFALELLRTSGVAVVPGSAFGKSSGRHIRCSFATSMDSLKEAMKRIESFMKSIGD